jgi:chromate transporter
MARRRSLAWTFLRIGALAFGGLGATLALIEEELVHRQKRLSRESFVEALTYTKLLPGSTVVQAVAFLSWRLGGWKGAVVWTTAFLLPSAAAMLALAYGYAQVAALPAAASATRGLLAAVVGLLLLTLFRLAHTTVTTPLARGLALAAFAAGTGLQVNVAWIVLAAGLVGILGPRR